jgi:hypothetical protein
MLYLRFMQPKVLISITSQKVAPPVEVNSNGSTRTFNRSLTALALLMDFFKSINIGMPHRNDFSAGKPIISNFGT